MGVPDSNPGWFVSWGKKRKAFDSFPMTNRSPYIVPITWHPNNVSFFMRDACGTVLVDRPVRARTTGRLLYPRMSYWLLPGSPRDVAPQPLLLNSFRFTKL